MPRGSDTPRIALLCPTNWDRLQLPRARTRLSERFTLLPYGPDAEADPAAFDPLAFIERAVADLGRRVDGVVSSSDYPGCLIAAMVAERLDLPGPPPEAVLRSSHKFYARQAMSRTAPEATPRFALINPADPMAFASGTLPFPFFVKPVKSWFSQHARAVSSETELAEYLGDPHLRWHLSEFVKPFNQLLQRHPEFLFSASHVIGEEILVGQQATVEGYILDKSVEVIGIVDSIMYPGTSSFQQFVYPSDLNPATAAVIVDTVSRAVKGLGLTWTLFNVEIMYDAVSGSIHVLEVNPRMCGQFADLMEAVNGVNTYEILCEVALGRNPTTRELPGRSAYAASFPRRRFVDGVVTSTPTPHHIAQIEQETSASLIAVYYRPGQRLSDVPKHTDGASFRYATINLAAESRHVLESLADQVEASLGLKID